MTFQYLYSIKNNIQNTNLSTLQKGEKHEKINPQNKVMRDKLLKNFCLNLYSRFLCLILLCLSCSFFLSCQPLNESNNPDEFAPSSMGEIIDIADGYYYSLVLCDDGNVWGRGFNENGQLGTGDEEYQLEWTFLIGDVAQISAYDDASMILKRNGDLYVAGDNQFGELGVNTSDKILSWTKVSSGIKSIHQSYFAITEDNTLMGTGYWDLDDYTESNWKPFLQDVIDVFSDDDIVLAIKEDHSLWGLYDLNNLDFDNWKKITDNVQDVGIDESHGKLYIVKNDNSLWGATWTEELDMSDWAKVGEGFESIYSSSVYLSYVFMTETSLIAIKSNGDMWCYGRGNHGELGTDSSLDEWTHVESNVAKVSCGVIHTSILKTNNEVWFSGAEIMDHGTEYDYAWPTAENCFNRFQKIL
jgi:alpha-tubulin suppressor-like RCC1 family protein